MNPYLKKRYNVTMNKYFTSFLLEEKFLSKNTTNVGTVRKDRCKMPNRDTAMKKKENYIQVKYIQMNLDAA